MFCYFLMVRLPPRSTLTDTLFPCTTLFRSRPTIATGCRSDDELVQEEVFGPVLTVQIAEDAAHALALANDSQYALVAGIYTTNFSAAHRLARSEEHTSELQSLMRISYAVFCLKKKNSKK